MVVVLREAGYRRPVLVGVLLAQVQQLSDLDDPAAATEAGGSP
jgi:hypothetical protein